VMTGPRLLVRAAELVLRQRPEIRFQLVGDGALKAALEQQALALGIDGAVSFLGHRPDVAALLRGSTLFAFPSLMEAFPNSVMEAMAAELPVVATRVGGIPELVDDGRTGILVAPGDHEGLAQGLLRVLGDAAYAARLAAAGRATVEERFSFGRMVTEFQSLYGELLAQRMSNKFPIPSQAEG
jgi:glycosyltransferase involved in cell wall biosynthesis